MEENKGKVMNATKLKLKLEAKARRRKSTIKGPNLNLHVNPSSMFEVRVFSNTDLKVNQKLQKAAKSIRSLISKDSSSGDDPPKTEDNVSAKWSQLVSESKTNQSRSTKPTEPKGLRTSAKDKVHKPKVNQSIVSSPDSKLPTDGKAIPGILKTRNPLLPGQSSALDKQGERRGSVRNNWDKNIDEDGQGLRPSKKLSIDEMELPATKESRQKKFRKLFCPAKLDHESSESSDAKTRARRPTGPILKKGSLAPPEAIEEETESELIGEQEEEFLGELEDEEGDYFDMLSIPLPDHLENAEEFSDHLRKSGAWKVLGNCFMSLYEEIERPDDPIGYFVGKMIVDVPTIAKIETALKDIACLKERLLSLDAMDKMYPNEELIPLENEVELEEELGEADDE